MSLNGRGPCREGLQPGMRSAFGQQVTLPCECDHPRLPSHFSLGTVCLNVLVRSQLTRCNRSWAIAGLTAFVVRCEVDYVR